MAVTGKVPWYRKVYSGAKLQAIWQVTVGVSVFLTFVVVPTWMEYLMTKRKTFIGNSTNKVSLKQKVYERRLEIFERLKNIPDDDDE